MLAISIYCVKQWHEQTQQLLKIYIADKTAAWIHSRIHAWDPHKYAVVFHTHQPWATALCCLKDPTYALLLRFELQFDLLAASMNV